MGRRLYVGNLPYSATEDQLTELFSRAGKVDSVRVMRDMATGRAPGFAFVEMGSDDDAQKAISEFHEHQMEGRALVVNLPGSPGGCRDGFAVIRPALRHGLELAAGDIATVHRQT